MLAVDTITLTVSSASGTEVVCLLYRESPYPGFEISPAMHNHFIVVDNRKQCQKMYIS